MKCRGRQSGVTIIELMIVIIVISVLVSVALPSYQNSVKRTKRTAAQAEMMEIANRQEQSLLADRAYMDKTALEAAGFSLDSDIASNYDYTITVGTGALPTYAITFTPKGAQASEGIMTLNQAGVGTPAGKWER